MGTICYEFLGDTLVDVAGHALARKADDWTAEICLGASFTNMSGLWSLHGDARLSSALNDFADSYEVKGTAGMTRRF